MLSFTASLVVNGRSGLALMFVYFQGTATRMVHISYPEYAAIYSVLGRKMDASVSATT